MKTDGSFIQVHSHCLFHCLLIFSLFFTFPHRGVGAYSTICRVSGQYRPLKQLIPFGHSVHSFVVAIRNLYFS